jgi:hypothetical protein
MSDPTMPEIRQAIDRARQLVELQDTEDFTLEAPRLLDRLVRILDLYVGHEPTLAEEDEHLRTEYQRMGSAIAEALRLLESAPEAFLGGSHNIGAATRLLRQAHEAGGKR